MEVEICLCVMCGIPGSGKSSFCERLNHELVNYYSIINVNYDKLLLSSNTDKVELHESLLENQNKAEDNLFKTARQQVFKLVDVIIQNLRRHGHLLNFDSLDGIEDVNKDVATSFLSNLQRNVCNSPQVLCSRVLILIDDNMYFSSMRYDFYKLARQYETGFCEVYTESSVEKALERNRMRQGRDLVSQEIIEKMTQEMEPPNPAKNHWEKYSVKLKTEEKIEIVLPMMREAFANPVQPPPQVDKEEQVQSQAVCSKNLIHQVDLILRKCVAKTIADGKKDCLDVRLLSRKAMGVKEEILNSLKCGNLSVHFTEPFIADDASKDENSVLYKYMCDLFNVKLKA